MGLGWCFVGLDLGQARDFTAVAIMERAKVVGAWDGLCAATENI
jgi:phage terminase large subunit-like protein